MDNKVKAIANLLSALSTEERNELALAIKGNEEEVKELSKEAIVSKLLRKIGTPAHIKGYQYLKYAIVSVLKEPELIEGVTKVLYPKVAIEFKTTPSRVERAIRHAIEVAWDRGEIEVLSEIFGNTISFNKGKATNSEFIAGVAEYIKENF